MTVIVVPMPFVVIGFVVTAAFIRMFFIAVMTGVIVTISNGWESDCKKTEETHHDEDHFFHQPPPKNRWSLSNPYGFHCPHPLRLCHSR